MRAFNAVAAWLVPPSTTFSYQFALASYQSQRCLAVAACLPRQCRHAVSTSLKEGRDLRLVRRFDCTDGLASPPVPYCTLERKLVSFSLQTAKPEAESSPKPHCYTPCASSNSKTCPSGSRTVNVDLPLVQHYHVPTRRKSPGYSKTNPS
jgi:hypothetical protein